MGGGDGGAAAAERARREEQARLERLKAEEQKRILADTLAEKTAKANNEAATSAARSSLMDKAKTTALEDPTKQKNKSLLQNYSN